MKDLRTTILREGDPTREGSLVIYWMTASRRLHDNHALDRAVGWAEELGIPLLIVEPLSVDYPHSAARISRFVAEGMQENAREAKRRGFAYICHVDRQSGESTSVLERLGKQAAIFITDCFPTRAYRKLHQAILRRLPKSVPVHAIDSNGLLPLGAGRSFSVAHSFRRHLHKESMAGFPAAAKSDPSCAPALRASIPPWLTDWDMSSSEDALLAACTVHPTVGSPLNLKGGCREANTRASRFLEGVRGYTERNQPDAQAASGLSPYLHFGHISAEAVFHRLLAQEGWDPSALDPSAVGKRAGFWGLSEGAESFIDELITWREVGFQFCFWNEDYDRYESLPDWARATLDRHEADPRAHVYSLEQFESASTHDEIWNAAQRQLVTEGIIHNYLRMLWGKNILAWTRSPQEALEIMELLNNRYAIDGRDPNSYTGIMWVLGRFDRAWGPERPVFGKVRYMTSRSTRTKLKLKNYLATYAAPRVGQTELAL